MPRRSRWFNKWMIWRERIKGWSKKTHNWILLWALKRRKWRNLTFSSRTWRLDYVMLRDRSSVSAKRRRTTLLPLKEFYRTLLPPKIRKTVIHSLLRVQSGAISHPWGSTIQESFLNKLNIIMLVLALRSKISNSLWLEVKWVQVELWEVFPLPRLLSKKAQLASIIQ